MDRVETGTKCAHLVSGDGWYLEQSIAIRRSNHVSPIDLRTVSLRAQEMFAIATKQYLETKQSIMDTTGTSRVSKRRAFLCNTLNDVNKDTVVCRVPRDTPVQRLIYRRLYRKLSTTQHLTYLKSPYSEGQKVLETRIHPKPLVSRWNKFSPWYPANANVYCSDQVFAKDPSFSRHIRGYDSISKCHQRKILSPW